MYIPKAFREDEVSSLHAFMQTYSFATLFTQQKDRLPMVSYVPFLLDNEPCPYGTLLGHIARANPHWKAFDGAQEVLAIFQGPHTYISPSWYEANEMNVPTWNYAVVHVYGRPHIIEDQAIVYKMLQSLVEKHEADFEVPWTSQLSRESLPKLLQNLIGFKIEITRLEGKFKLSQNRSIPDQLHVITALQNSSNEQDTAVAALMNEQINKRQDRS